MTRIDKLLTYINEHGKESFLQQALAEEYIKINNDNEARNVLNDLLLREPTYITAYIHLGNILVRVGDEAKAIRIFSRGIAEATKAKNSVVIAALQEALEEIIY